MARANAADRQRTEEAPPQPEPFMRLAVVSQRWCDEDRTVEAVLRYLGAAADRGADLVLLPQQCVKTEGQPIPGPVTKALADAARTHKMYVVGNIREKADGGPYVTSLLLAPDGTLVGTYRKSHKMPDEAMALGDALPVFDTAYGKVAMRVGSDRFFADIDHVYTAKGARIILWSQVPEPVEDEYSQDFPSLGRAVDYRVVIACARYASGRPGYITNKYPPYCGRPIGRAYVVSREGQRIACTPRTGGGVAVATIGLRELKAGRGPNRNPAFAALAGPVSIPPEKKWARRKVRLAVIEAHVSEDDLLAKLDRCGEMDADIVCTYEFVWIHKKDEKQQARARDILRQVAARADEHDMYVLVAGVIERRERNVGILFGRDGKEVGRYRKIATTYEEQVPGDATPVFETDFGRVACRICADEWMVELDRTYGVKGADILFTPTQSWGADALFRDLRDISRAMDTGMFLVEATHPATEVRHRSLIIEPTGVVVRRSRYRVPDVFCQEVDLDHDRPLRYVRRYKPHEPKGYLPEYQPTRLPEAANDLRETILRQRRPELYQVLAPAPPAEGSP